MESATLETEIGACLDHGDWDGAVTLGYRGYAVEVLRFIVTLLHDRGHAEGEDLAAELFLALVKRRATFARRSTFRSFVYGVARNLAVSALRGAARRPTLRLSSAAAEALVNEVRSNTPDWQRSSVKDALARIRAGLDVDEQTLLVLTVDRCMSSEEVAEVMSEPDRPISAALVRKRFERLRRKLRARLEEQGLLGDE